MRWSSIVVLSLVATVAGAQSAPTSDSPVATASALLAEAAQAPGSAEAINACARVVAIDTDDATTKQAIDAIVTSGADPKLLVALTQSIARVKPSRGTEALLRALVDRVEQRDVQGWACYTLGKLLLAYEDDVRYATDEKVEAAAKEAYAKQRGAALVAANVARGAATLRAEGVAAMRRVVDDFYFADHRKAGYLGAVVTAELFELENLQVGMKAPEIEGVDEDGAPFKLADYRGKVVAVDFWGYWCPICVHNIAPERELVKKVGDDAFALVGINSDPKDHLAIGMKHLPLSWRSFWDGGDPYGPIATKWNVQEWPMYYVLDEEGVIRAKGEDFDAISAKVEELVAAHRAREAASAGAPARSVEPRDAR